MTSSHGGPLPYGEGPWDEVASEAGKTPAAGTKSMGRTPHPYRHLASTNQRGVRARRCPCGTPTLTGLDDDQVAGVVTVDAVPLSALGEALAILGGRRTYTLDGQPARLTRRDAQRIKLKPAGKPIKPWHSYDILPAHQCAQPIPADLSIPTMLAAKETKTQSNDDPAPF